MVTSIEPLQTDDWIYLWADGVYRDSRSGGDKLCALVIIGVNARGEKHFLAIEDGVRESTQSWREVLLKLKHRGLTGVKLAIGDGAMGFWAALEEVYPATTQQRCWMHKTANVLNALPKYRRSGIPVLGWESVRDVAIQTTTQIHECLVITSADWIAMNWKAPSDSSFIFSNGLKNCVNG